MYESLPGSYGNGQITFFLALIGIREIEKEEETVIEMLDVLRCSVMKFLLLYRYIYKLRTTEITENGS